MLMETTDRRVAYAALSVYGRHQYMDRTWTYSATCRNLLSLYLLDTRKNTVRNSLRQPIFTICTKRSDRLAADIWLI